MSRTERRAARNRQQILRSHSRRLPMAMHVVAQSKRLALLSDERKVAILKAQDRAQARRERRQ